MWSTPPILVFHPEEDGRFSGLGGPNGNYMNDMSKCRASCHGKVPLVFAKPCIASSRSTMSMTLKGDIRADEIAD